MGTSLSGGLVHVLRGSELSSPQQSDSASFPMAFGCSVLSPIPKQGSSSHVHMTALVSLCFVLLTLVVSAITGQLVASSEITTDLES